MKPLTKASVAAFLIRSLSLSSILRRVYPIAIAAEFKQVNQAALLTIGRYFKRYSDVRSNLVRLGSSNDGGYVVFQDFDATDVVLSFGIGDNNSFDKDIGPYVDVVQMYDHTIDSLPSEFGNGVFYRVGISHLNISGFYTVPEILSVIPKNVEIVLKIDIEGSEWDIFNSLDFGHLLRFKQIFGEFHGMHDLISTIEGQEKIVAVLEKLTSSHTFVNLHANNWARTDLIQGFLVPDVLEFTLVRNDRLLEVQSEQAGNQSLNQSNNPNAPEIYLGFLSE